MRRAFNLTLSLILLLGTTLSAATDKQPFTQSIKKEFALPASGSFNLENQYGDVDIQTWDRERLRLEVVIRVEARSETAARKLFDRIDIQIQHSPNEVSARTILDGGWNRFTDKVDFRIDYRVWMPEGAELKLSNRYGNTSIGSLARTAEIDVRYGDLALESVGERLELDLSYGKAQLERVKDAEVAMKYADLTVAQARDIRLESSYSKARFREVASVRTNSRYDQFTIGAVRDFRFEGRYGTVKIERAENVDVYSKYTQVEVGQVANRAELDMHYGGAQLERIEKGFSKVRLVGRYANYRVAVDEDASFRLDGEGEYANLRVPDQLRVARDQREGNRHSISGHRGISEARSVITVRLNYGGVRIN